MKMPCRLECRVKFTLKVVFTANRSNDQISLNFNCTRHMRDTANKRKEKKKGKKKSSGVTNHYNTKANKIYYNQ